MSRLTPREEKMVVLESLINDFEEMESASHGMTSRRIRDELDTMADEIRELEDELDLPECERYLP